MDLPRPKRRRVEIADLDAFHQPAHDWPEQEFDAVRNPELGPWPETVRLRVLVAAILTALPLSLLALLLVWTVRSSANSVAAEVDVLANQPAAQWQPTSDVVAEMAADHWAVLFGLRIVARVDTVFQAESAGLTVDQFVGVAPDRASITPRRAWMEATPGLARHSYLLRRDVEDYEVLSFFVTSGGEVTWPTMSPVNIGTSDGPILGMAASEGGEISTLEDYETLRVLLGVASDGAHPTRCGAVSGSGSGSASDALEARIAEFVDAYVARNAATLAEIANSGEEWPVYARSGWRVRDGSLRVLCVDVDEDAQAGVAQVWWLAESTDEPMWVIPEVRDVVVVNNSGLWQVSGAALFGSGGFRPN